MNSIQKVLPMMVFLFPLLTLVSEESLLIEASVPIDYGLNHLSREHHFLADPLADIEWSEMNYSHFSPSTEILKNIDIMWFYFDNIDNDPFYIYSIEEELQNKLLPQFEINPQMDMGLEFTFNDSFWNELLVDPGLWQSWVLFLLNAMDSSKIKFLQISHIPAAYNDLFCDKSLPFLIDEASVFNIEITLGVQTQEQILDIKDILWNLQAYDYSGKHSTLEAVEEQLYLLSQRNFPMNKVKLSIPFYGRNANSKLDDYWFQTKPYIELIEHYSPDVASNQAGDFFYNGPVLLQKKIALSSSYGLKAIRLENLQWDSHKEGYSLLTETLNIIR